MNLLTNPTRGNTDTAAEHAVRHIRKALEHLAPWNPRQSEGKQNEKS